jgi:hypothetical protein
MYPPVAGSAEITHADVVKDGARYRIEIDVRVAVPQAGLLSVLVDYSRYIKLSPAIIESRVVKPEEEGLRLYLVLRPCVFGFCRKLVKLTDVRWLSDNTVEYLGLPGEGDFDYSRETISVEQLSASTGVSTFRYRAELQPGFFVPPLIGTWIISRQIRHELLVTLGGIEDAYQSGL